MKWPDDFVNKIIHGNCIEILEKIPDESIDCVVTSPPYYGLRNYGEEVKTIWGGDRDCKHKFETKSWFCKKCSAWYGQLGFEPTPELYIEHLLIIFKEIKRVLKKTGTLWVNINDSYNNKNATIGRQDKFKNGKSKLYCLRSGTKKLPPKTLLLVPFKFAIGMQNMRWIVRNVIIWWKPNSMPQSARDRFTVDYEYLFFFFFLQKMRNTILNNKLKVFLILH